MPDRTTEDPRLQQLNEIADRMVSRHWHVSDLPWSELPPLPVPADADPRRRRALIAFGKRAIEMQLAAEHVAVAAAHHLLRHPDCRSAHPAVGRGLAALLNDEASHVSVMIELRVRADRAYPDVRVEPVTSPLFDRFLELMPDLHPAGLAISMGAYEAMIAIRSYAEEAAYRYPSILGRMADLAAQDDALHARILRLVSHVLLDEIRRATPDAPSAQARIREVVLEPILPLWPMVVEHERLLLNHDERFSGTLSRRLAADAALLRRFIGGLGMAPPDLRQSAGAA